MGVRRRVARAGGVAVPHVVAGDRAGGRRPRHLNLGVAGGEGQPGGRAGSDGRGRRGPGAAGRPAAAALVVDGLHLHFVAGGRRQTGDGRRDGRAGVGVAAPGRRSSLPVLHVVAGNGRPAGGVRRDPRHVQAGVGRRRYRGRGGSRRRLAHVGNAHRYRHRVGELAVAGDYVHGVSVLRLKVELDAGQQHAGSVNREVIGVRSPHGPGDGVPVRVRGREGAPDRRPNALVLKHPPGRGVGPIDHRRPVGADAHHVVGAIRQGQRQAGPTGLPARSRGIEESRRNTVHPQDQRLQVAGHPGPAQLEGQGAAEFRCVEGHYAVGRGVNLKGLGLQASDIVFVGGVRVVLVAEDHVVQDSALAGGQQGAPGPMVLAALRRGRRLHPVAVAHGVHRPHLHLVVCPDLQAADGDVGIGAGVPGVRPVGVRRRVAGAGGVAVPHVVAGDVAGRGGPRRLDLGGASGEGQPGGRAGRAVGGGGGHLGRSGAVQGSGSGTRHSPYVVGVGRFVGETAERSPEHGGRARIVLGDGHRIEGSVVDRNLPGGDAGVRRFFPGQGHVIGADRRGGGGGLVRGDGDIEGQTDGRGSVRGVGPRVAGRRRHLGDGRCAGQFDIQGSHRGAHALGQVHS